MQQQDNQQYQYPQMYPPQGQPIQGQPIQGYPVDQSQPYMQGNGQPQQGYYQQPPQQGIPVVVQPIYIEQNSNLPTSAEGCAFPAQIRCIYCKQQVKTIVKYRSGGNTWCVCLILFLFFTPLFFLPFCLKDCKDKVHICPSCNKEVGIKEYRLC